METIYSATARSVRTQNPDTTSERRQEETNGKRKNIENYYTPYPKQHLSAQFLFFPPPKDSHVFLSEHMWLTSNSSKGRDGPWSVAFRSKYSLPLPETSTRKSTTLHLVYFQRLELLPKIIVHTRPATATSNQPLNMLDSSRRPRAKTVTQWLEELAKLGKVCSESVCN